MDNHGSLNKDEIENPEGWVSRKRALSVQEELILANLKTVSTLSKLAWLGLARLYKNRHDFPRAEIAFVGARYCDPEDRDLMREWLGVVQMNRATTMTKEAMLYEANALNQGLFDVVNGPQERILKELQSLLFFIEREEVVDVGEGSDSVTTWSGEGDGKSVFEKDKHEKSTIITGVD